MGRLTRNPEIVAREIDDAVFLVGAGNDAVFHLNPVGAAIWRLLAEPVSEADLTQTLIDAFPHIPTGQIRSDLGKIIRDLDARGFLVKID
ncbi:MAG: PqqD family protein [Proteobacteria bacterium]|nr:PqqD family protein [Pseudomonadota bacterium]MDA1324508.1 PqqD family protein [Pseudomonadota bacterium]